MSCEVNLPELTGNLRWRIKVDINGSDFLALEARHQWVFFGWWSRVDKFYIFPEFHRSYNAAVESASRNIMKKYNADISCRDSVIGQVNND